MNNRIVERANLAKSRTNDEVIFTEQRVVRTRLSIETDNSSQASAHHQLMMS